MSIIRQAAFTGSQRLLKGALHCHTTRSDGSGTPEEVIRLHKENGYDFMALTDHRKYNYKNYAPETDMLIIPGMEMDRGIEGREGVHCFHIVCIGKPEGENPYQQDQVFDSGLVKDQFAMQPLLDQWHEDGQLTIYCHPEWSNTPAREFDQLKGNFAMEIWNSGCVIENGLDTNAAWWDELLMQGQKIYGVATDDGHAMHQHCKGWVRVNADRSIHSVRRALLEGAFYSSCGPEIYDFYIEDGQAVIECSPCAEIVVRTDIYPCPRLYSPTADLTRHTFKVPGCARYLRITVTDAQGRRAWTNPIFLD